MAESILRKTKESNEIEDNIYKIDFGIEEDKKEDNIVDLNLEIAKEIQPQRDSNGNIIKVIDDDEIDDIFGNVGGLEINENDIDKKIKKKKLTKIEDGIKSSKTTTKVAKAKTSKATKTPGKRGRKPKLKDIETIWIMQEAIETKGLWNFFIDIN